MSEMIERGAEHLFTEVVFIPNTEGLVGTNLEGAQESWSQLTEEGKDIWRGRFRSVLRTMREPTKDMLAATFCEPGALEDWQLMIDASLKQ